MALTLPPLTFAQAICQRERPMFRKSVRHQRCVSKIADGKRGLQVMLKLSAENTAAIWSAVGMQPYDDALLKLREEGWYEIESGTKHEMQFCIFARNGKRVTVYAQNDCVGMIWMDQR